MEEASELFGSPTDSTVPNRTTFDELIELLANFARSDQISLDDQIEIGRLQLQVFDSQNAALERSANEKAELKKRLAEQEGRWSELNSQLDEAVDLVVALKAAVGQLNVGLEVAFEKKLNYLNFLLDSAQSSTDSGSLRQFLDVRRRSPDAGSPYSTAMRAHHFQLNATKSTSYDLKGLAKLAEKIENELKGIYRLIRKWLCQNH